LLNHLLNKELGETMNQEILDNLQLAERWKLIGTPDAIAKRFQRLRALPKANPRHLKAFKVGNQTRYRLADILEYEDRNSEKRRKYRPSNGASTVSPMG
jgi:hypothetical protein